MHVVNRAADRFERRDALVELATPTARETLPVSLRRRTALRERVERLADALKRNACRLAGLNECHTAKCDARIAALVAVRPPCGNQSLAFVEPKR